MTASVLAPGFSQLPQLSELDQLLYDLNLFSPTAARDDDPIVELVRPMVAYHAERCPAYGRLCAARGFSADDLDSPASLHRVPLIPSSAFKRQLLLSCEASSVVKLCLSSGTNGTQSRVPRDNVTLERLLGSVQSQVDRLIGMPDRAWVYNLGPSADEAGDLWFAYVMGILELIAPATHYVVNGGFQLDRLAADLDNVPNGVEPIIVGPPALFLRLVDELERDSRTLPIGARNGVVVTAGGWKRHGDEAIGRREFRERLARALMLSPERIRDAFNMVELNTVIVECEHHAKHVPPWLHVSARDPATTKPVPPGEVGVLAYLDPTATSYPGFILSDDFGRVLPERCRCGRSGLVMEMDRRIRRVETRGCALKMDTSSGSDTSNSSATQDAGEHHVR